MIDLFENQNPVGRETLGKKAFVFRGFPRSRSINWMSIFSAYWKSNKKRAIPRGKRTLDVEDIPVHPSGLERSPTDGSGQPL